MKKTVVVPYIIESYGISLLAACIEIVEMNVRTGQGYYVNSNIMQPEEQENFPFYSNTLVRFKVYADKAAYDSGKAHLTEREVTVDLNDKVISSMLDSILTSSFPEPTIPISNPKT